MRTAIIITKDRLDLHVIAHNFSRHGRVDKVEDRLVVERPNGWFSLGIDDSILDDYDEDELHFVKQTLSRFFFAYLEFSTVDTANFALLHMDIPSDSLIDNDHGNIVSIEIIRYLIVDSIDWSALTA